MSRLYGYGLADFGQIAVLLGGLSHWRIAFAALATRAAPWNLAKVLRQEPLKAEVDAFQEMCADKRRIHAHFMSINALNYLASHHGRW
jgi:hypothetical protein